MRELELVMQYLEKVRLRHIQDAMKIAGNSLSQDDYLAITRQAMMAEYVAKLMKNLNELEKDPAEFIKLFLS